MIPRPHRPRWLLILGAIVAVARSVAAEQTVDLVGNVYCRASAEAGERPWGGVRVYVKGRPQIHGDSEPEHGRYRLTLPLGEALTQKLTLVFAQSNLLLDEDEQEVSRDDTLILSGQPTAQIAPKVFVVPYCTELQTPRLREMVRSLVDRISHRAAIVHEELVRAHRFGSPETANCLDDVLSRMGAHLRHAESRVPHFMDALGQNVVIARREVNVIKIADERSLELEKEANFCLEHHATHPGQDSSRYLPDLSVSPSGYFGTDGAVTEQAVPWNRVRPSDGVRPTTEPGVWAFGTALETGYDTNFLLSSRETARAAWHVRPTAFASYKYFDAQQLAATPNTESAEPNYEFNLGLLGLLLSATDGRREGLSQYSDLGIAANARSKFVGQGPLSGAVFGQYLRRIEPSNEPEYQSTNGQNDWRLGAEAVVKLGQGRFDWGAGYTLGGVLHDSAAAADFDRYEHRFSVSERLRFLPETAFVHETEYRLRAYSNTNNGLHDSGQLRTRLGTVGMLFHRLGFQAWFGWGQSDYSAAGAGASNFDGWLALAKLEWFFGPVAKTDYAPHVLVRPSLALVYERDYRDHVVTDYYLRDRGSVQLSLTDGADLLWMLTAGISKITYPNFTGVSAGGITAGASGVTNAETEYRLDAGTALEYRLFRGLRLTGRLELNENKSDVLPVTKDGAVAPTSLGFVRYQALGGILYSR